MIKVWYVCHYRRWTMKIFTLQGFDQKSCFFWDWISSQGQELRVRKICGLKCTKMCAISFKKVTKNRRGRSNTVRIAIWKTGIGAGVFHPLYSIHNGYSTNQKKLSVFPIKTGKKFNLVFKFLNGFENVLFSWINVANPLFGLTKSKTKL